MELRGRIADHFANERFAKTHIKTLILDEFDKSLEVGFEYEMRGIINQLTTLNKRILTSATQGVEVPECIKLDQAKTINYLKKKVASKLEVKTVIAAAKNKSETLVDLILHIGNQPGIVFCNLKDSVNKVSAFLAKNKISHSCFSGGMEQRDRERSLIKFRNGTSHILIATDLAARGIDIPELNLSFITNFPRLQKNLRTEMGELLGLTQKGPLMY